MKRNLKFVTKEIAAETYNYTHLEIVYKQTGNRKRQVFFLILFIDFGVTVPNIIANKSYLICTCYLRRPLKKRGGMKLKALVLQLLVDLYYVYTI